MTDDPDITIPLMPFDADALEHTGPAVLSAQPFAYIGEALTGEQFIDYVRSYDFGSVPPSFVVLHNTANPDASWAKLNSDPSIKWDRGEAGLSEAQIKAKRKTQLDAIMRYYVSLGWQTGPHLFIDERWIWLFTPMYEVGTHAKSGNSYHDAAGHLHYSIGIETVGYFEHNGWPATMQKLLQIAVQSLRDRLKNFEIVYKAGPVNTPSAHDHSVSFHRDYNKPGCPGGIITAEYAIPILSTPYASTTAHYTVRGLPIYQRQDLTGPLAGVLATGEHVAIDATYPNGAGHDALGRGFVDMDGLERR